MCYILSWLHNEAGPLFKSDVLGAPVQLIPTDLLIRKLVLIAGKTETTKKENNKNRAIKVHLY